MHFDLKDYNRIDHGYAATIHKAQGMTVDRTHVLATPGMDAHGSYVALSRHRDGMDLHYGRDDFASQDRLTRTLSRDRSKDMASDYEQRDPAQKLCRAARDHLPRARRRDRAQGRAGEGAQHVRRPPAVLPSCARPGWRTEAGTGNAGKGKDGGRPGKAGAAEDPHQMRAAYTLMPAPWMRSSRCRRWAARPVPEQVKELQEARKVFEEVRPYGSHDAEAAYKKNPELVREAAGGQVNRAIRALQLETELRTDPSRRADRFVERWQKLDHTSQRQYQAGDMSGYKATRSAMGDMAKSLERDPQLESILANRKRELGIAFESGRRLGQELAFTHGIDLGRGRGIGI